MTRSDQVSPVPEIGTPGLRWRGLETAYGEPTRARSWKRRIQPRGAYGALRQSSTRLKTAKALGLTVPPAVPDHRGDSTGTEGGGGGRAGRLPLHSGV